MIRVKHPSGQERILNVDNIECIYSDAAGFAIARMVSGAEYTVHHTYQAFVEALGQDIPTVEDPGPEHPETAQKGPLGMPLPQSPAGPVRGIMPGAPGYNEAVEAERTVQAHQEAHDRDVAAQLKAEQEQRAQAKPSPSEGETYAQKMDREQRERDDLYKRAEETKPESSKKKQGQGTGESGDEGE